MLVKITVAVAVIVLLTLAVVGLSQTLELQQHRIIPIREMTQDVEILYGDPEAEG
jgi:CHASE1-domain containing sensor protein